MKSLSVMKVNQKNKKGQAVGDEQELTGKEKAVQQKVKGPWWRSTKEEAGERQEKKRTYGTEDTKKDEAEHGSSWRIGQIGNDDGHQGSSKIRRMEARIEACITFQWKGEK